MKRTLLLLSTASAAGVAQVPADLGAQGAFAAKYCVECHGGDATKGKLDLVAAAPDAVARLMRWSRMRARLLAGEMPPADAERPAAAERAAFVQWVDQTLRTEVPKLPLAPGRTTVRRLTRSQWENCVRDLFGVRVSTAAFPADDLGYGFDTIGDALSFSTLHLEKYLAAAGAVAASVLDDEDPQHPTVRRFEAESMQVVDGPGANQDGDVAGLYTRATIERELQLPRDGVYRVRVLAGADQAGDEPAKMALHWDGRELDTFEVAERAPRQFELTAPLLAGPHRLGLEFTNDFYQPEHPDAARRDRNLRIDWCEVTGPLDARVVPAEQQWVAAALAKRGAEAGAVRGFARELLQRAWRRPVTDAEVARVAAIVDGARKAGETATAALRLAVQAALASPNFLFRLETGGVEGKAGDAAPVPGPVLASRLSFFLWGSMPDARLLDLAAKGKLAEGQTLQAEVQRLLVDGRAESLAVDFAAQWLELRNLGDRMPDPARFPGFDDTLRASLRRETELLFLAILRDGSDVRDLLDCDFTHVDATLARYYGLDRPAGAGGFVRVPLPPALRERGGVLGHGSVLAVTSNPTRTSPVKRGKWILENLLGQPPPPPPPGNDSLPDEKAIDSSKTFREQLAQHRQRAECAACHVRMDTLGFALERFDAIGRHRTNDAGGPIDCSGELPGGVRIDGIAELKAVLAADPAFLRVVAKKLFVYAIGRDLRPIDELRLDLAVDALRAKPKITLQDLVLVIVQSDPFLRREVERPR